MSPSRLSQSAEARERALNKMRRAAVTGNWLLALKLAHQVHSRNPDLHERRASREDRGIADELHHLSLRALLELAPDPLEARDLLAEHCPHFDPGWLAAILAVAPGAPRHLKEALRLLVEGLSSPYWYRMVAAAPASWVLEEALRHAYDLDELETLARRTRSPRLWAALIQARLRDGRLDEAVRAAAKARALLAPGPMVDVALGWLEARLAVQSGDGERARARWRWIWENLRPTDAMAEAFLGGGDEGRRWLEQLREAAWSDPRAMGTAHLLLLELLLGDLELIIERLRAAERTRWWTEPEHPAVPVLLILMRLGAGRPCLRTEGELDALWSELAEYVEPRPRLREWAGETWQPAIEAAIRQHPTWLRDHPVWRAESARQLGELTAAAVGSKARLAEQRCVALHQAWFDAVLQAQAPPWEVEAALASLRRRLPRHRRIHDELQRIWHDQADAFLLAGN